MSPNNQTGPDTQEIMTSAQLAVGFHDACQAAFDAEAWQPAVDQRRPQFERVSISLANGLKLEVNRPATKTRPLPNEEEFVLVIHRAGMQPLSGAITQYLLGVTRRKLELHEEDGHGDRKQVQQATLTSPRRQFLTELLTTFNATVTDRAERVRRNKTAAAKLAKYQKHHQSPAGYI